MVENPDILAGIGHHNAAALSGRRLRRRDAEPAENAAAKLKKKGADFIVANDVSAETGVMGGDTNRVRIVSKAGVDEWPEFGKEEVAVRLAALIAERLKTIAV